jgi:hypothetical protein
MDDNEDFSSSMRKLVESLIYSQGRAMYEAVVAICKAKGQESYSLPWEDLTAEQRSFWDAMAEQSEREAP